MEQALETLPRTINKSEFDVDYKARTQIEIPLSFNIFLKKM